MPQDKTTPSSQIFGQLYEQMMEKSAGKETPTGWQPIESAPRDHPIVVYAPARDGLPDMASLCQWHPDAGFCIDELRSPTHWMEKPP